MKKISDLAYEIVSKYKEQSVEILPGLYRKPYDIIKRIYFYKNDKFMQCTDENAIFWQVVTQYVPHFAKLIDVDPKDFRPVGKGDVNFYQSWVLRKEFEKFVKDENFDVEIDDLTKNVSAFGSYIWKVIDKDIQACDLRNIYFDATAKTVRETPIVELHYLTESEIREKEYDNEKDLIKNAKKVDGKLELFEFTGNYEYKEGKYDYYHCIGAGSGDKEVIGFEEYIDKEECPYYDFHLSPYEGTWLRKGNYETCFPEQERANTIVNENAQATSIASLLLLRSSDPNTSGNVLHQAISGQIINSQDLQQIGIDNRAFTTLLNELDKIERQVQRKLMLPDIATGDNLPSGTPFRGMALMASSYKSAFKQIRTRVASGITDILENKILPLLVKDWNKGDMLELAENVEDIKMYDEAIRNVARINLYSRANQNGTIVTPEAEAQLNDMVDSSLRVNGRKLQVPKNFFDFDYGIQLDPVGEVYDKAQQNDAIVQSITWVLQNPSVSEIPLFRQLLENNGITPFKLTMEQKQALTQMNQPGAAQGQNLLSALNQQTQENV